MVSDCGGTPTRFGRTNPDWTPPTIYPCEVCGCLRATPFDGCEECEIKAFLTPSEYALYRKEVRCMFGRDKRGDGGEWFLIRKYVISNEDEYYKRIEKFYDARNGKKHGGLRLI